MDIKVLDTTLRDGEQTPGISLITSEKLRIASKLDSMNVDYIEAGSAIISKGERDSIKEITKQGFNAEILSFSRPLQKDIDYCLSCDVDAVNLVVPTSDLHISQKLKKSKEELLQMSNSAIQYCKDHGLTVELAAEDASRSDIDFLRTVFKNAEDFKVDRLCICDTVGILTPDLSYNLFSQFNDLSKPIACHCHNDFGLAVANTLAAINAGASEFHSTVNGIGERAGNTSFEEVVVAINFLFSDYSTNVNIHEIYSISKLVSRLTGMVPPNKPIVGENAFAHESGIHADGIIKNSKTYEPISPELVGQKRKFVLGKHMGSHALNNRLNELGVEVSQDQLSQIFNNVKDLADKGKVICDVDLLAITENVLNINHDDRIHLKEITVVSGNNLMPTASVKLSIDGNEILEAGVGIGPVDAAINAVNKSISQFGDIELVEYHVDAITGGTDALINLFVKIKKGDEIISARSTEPDIVNASVKAYISAVNRLVSK